MEADIDHLFRNETSNEWHSIYNDPLFIQIHISIQTVFCIIGLTFDSMIIFILYNSKRMKNRTNMLILNWAVCDALFLLLSPPIVTVFMDREFISNHRGVYCSLDDAEIIFQLACVLLILCLFSNTIYKSKRLNDYVMYGVLYGGLVILFIYNIVSCFQRQYGVPFLYITSSFLMLAVALFLISKELHSCYRCIRKKPLSKTTNFRRNIGRIYLYGWVISIFFFAMGFPYSLENLLVYIFGYLSSIYITIYMSYANNNFKICLLNLWRCKWNQYDVDLTIAFAEDSTDCEEDDIARNTTINFRNEQARKENGESV